MKTKIFLFTLLMSYLLPCNSQHIIPGATQQPAWVFPLYFEDGTGQKDTLYFGYDSSAIDGYDSIFGEKSVIEDTSKFYVFFEYCCPSPAYYGTNVFMSKDSFELSNGSSIWINKGLLPLTIRWDINAFYSDSLPFPDKGTAPRVQGKLWFDMPNCSWGDGSGCGFWSYQFPVLITDTGYQCYAKDSIYFEDCYENNNYSSGFSFSIQSWLGYLVSVNTLAFSNITNYTFSPNPFNNTSELNFYNYKTTLNDIEFKIFDVLGQSVNIPFQIFKQDEQFKIQITRGTLPNGIYFYSVKNKNFIINTGKFIIN